MEDSQPKRLNISFTLSLVQVLDNRSQYLPLHNYRGERVCSPDVKVNTKLAPLQHNETNRGDSTENISGEFQAIWEE